LSFARDGKKVIPARGRDARRMRSREAPFRSWRGRRVYTLSWVGVI